jgi:exosortase D (VPLPA-CTERM-specific)
MEKEMTIWSYKTSALIVLGAGFLIVVPTFWEGISELISRWDKQEEYSHGYMIPLVTAYLIWQRKGLLETLEFKPSWLPVGLVALGLVVALIGEISALYILIHLPLILIILTMAWSFMGWNAFKYVIVPLALLAFAIPLPVFLEATLTADLQLVSSKLGVAFIRLFGIPVHADGNVIDLGGYQLQVVEACSGLRYLYPLVGVGFIVAYLYQVELWKRALVFISTIPITILMNSLRIGIIGILVEHWGQGMAEGFLHYFEGWIIFIVCLALLLGEMWLLNRFSRNPVSFMQVFSIPSGPKYDDDEVEFKTRELSKPFVACVVLVVVAFLVMQKVDTREEVIPAREKFVSFPLDFNGWSGEQENLQPIVYSKLALTDYVLNNYSKESSPPVNFYVAYYESQRKGASPHSPRVCIPGGGWSITDLERVKLVIKNSNAPLNVNRAIIQNGRHKQLVYYWFKQRGRDIANEYWMKWYLLTDSLTRNRTDGSLVRLTTPILANEKETDAENRLNQFLLKVNPMLDEFVPI